MKNLISVPVLQIGTGRPLPTAETMLVNMEMSITVTPTQPQSGGAPYANGSRFITDHATQSAVYSMIAVGNGIGSQPVFYFSSDTVAAIKAKTDA